MAHRTCSEPDCESTDYYAVGLCRSHYDRQRRLRRLPPVPVRYLPDENGCWIWRWYVHSSGYGMVHVGRNCITCAHLHSLARSRGGIDAVAAPITDEQAFADAVERRARELAGSNHRHGAIPARFWRAAIVEFATMGEMEDVA